ncbi:ATP-binding protein [Parvularcula sp. LCG005]|uniref:ATP-binding protein n=1 Tax=Parvularcula sp. LCG005 TaxID=3078805 RepID=UPI0029436489|nr:ATP-binding protein [Parvularcula sp. LCG005]WOI52507.1 ATP-binding protein [Parvularcula sp. LCG005]
MHRVLSKIGSHLHASLRLKIIILSSVISLVTSAVLSIVFITNMSNASYEMARESVAHESALVAVAFRSAYEQIDKDVEVIARMPPVDGIRRSTAYGDVDPLDGSSTEMWTRRLETIFSSMMEARPAYTQVRYIGAANNGRELVRVNRLPDGEIEFVRGQQLQEKGNEPYFQEAMTLPQGKTYFSKVTYNREFGDLDDNLLPTLRVAVPVFDSAGRADGIIVVNVNYAVMLTTRLRQLEIRRNILVTNEDGNHIEMFDDGRISRFEFADATLNPGDREAASVSPGRRDVAEWRKEHADNIVASVVVPIAEDVNETRLVVSVRVPQDALFAAARTTQSKAILFAILLAALAIVATALVATRMTEPLKQITRRVRAVSRDGGPLDLPTDRSDEIGELASAFETMAADLIHSEGKVRAIFDNVVDGVLTIDRDGYITAYNPAAERIFGYTIKQALGEHVALLLDRNELDETLTGRELLAATDITRSFGVAREFEGRRSDGTVFPAEFSVSQLYVGEAILYTMIVRDVTERTEMNTVKDEFVSTVSHELRTPLTSIRASLGVLGQKLSGQIGDKEQRLLDISIFSVNRLGKIVNDILDLEKISAGQLMFHPEPGDISLLVKDIVDRHMSLGEDNEVTFKVTSSISNVYCSVDPSRLNQAIVNLLSNAAKFSPRGETVAIEVDALEDDKVRIKVTDRGPGIPVAFRERIFQRFAQADSSATRATGGSGLGLSITKTIVEALNGAIHFQSEEGQGTTFIIDLPTCSPDSTAETTSWQAA